MYIDVLNWTFRMNTSSRAKIVSIASYVSTLVASFFCSLYVTIVFLDSHWNKNKHRNVACCNSMNQP